MRIAVSGSHCCGKSTLAADFLAAHPEYAHEPEPYEWLEEIEPLAGTPSADDFVRQLAFGVERLRGFAPGARLIVEHSPADFIAYLRALGAHDLANGSLPVAEEGLRHLDLIVYVPAEIDVPDCEDPELRRVADEWLGEIYAGGELELPAVIEVRGTPAERLAAVEKALFMA